MCSFICNWWLTAPNIIFLVQRMKITCGYNSRWKFCCNVFVPINKITLVHLLLTSALLLKSAADIIRFKFEKIDSCTIDSSSAESYHNVLIAAAEVRCITTF
ncbi:hypothetical protein ACOSQ4_032630 [Xanthoceras sorbifolium]